MKRLTSSIFISIAAIGCAHAQAQRSQQFVADFSELNVGFVHGAVLSGNEFTRNPSLYGGGFTFEVDSANGLNTGIIFNTNVSGSADPDLEAPFIGGNLAGQRLGDLLIIADNLNGLNNGIVADPNDSASGGTVSLSFQSNSVTAFGFALVDAPEQGETFSISFSDSSGRSRAFSLQEYVDITNTQNFAASNNFANQFAQLDASTIGLSNFKNVDLNLKGSGGFDNFIYTESTPVPEPSGALLSLLGLSVLIRRRR